MRFIETVLFAATIGTLSFGQTPVTKDKTETEILQREVSLYEFRYSDTPSIIQSAFVKAHLPGGIVVVNCGKDRKRYAFSRPRISIQNLLLSVEQIDPEYAWELSDGVINLLPYSGTPKFLETQFKEFSVQRVTSYEALILLLERQETKDKKVALGLDAAVSSINIPSSYDPERSASDSKYRFDLNLRNVTFRQILNAIVKKDGDRTWYYTETRCGGETEFSVFLVG